MENNSGAITMEKLYEDRFSRVKSEMVARGLDGLLVTDQYSIWYLSGIWNEPYERMYVLYVSRDGAVKLFVNKLFNIPANDFENFWYSDTDDYVGLLASQIGDSPVGKSGCFTVGVDKTWAARFLIPLMEKKPGLRFVLGSDCVDNCRACKDAKEIELMKEASRINDVVIEKAMAFVHEGVTEREIAEYIDQQFKAEGAEGASFETIVSFGANAANPHHEPDDTVVQPGDCVLIDMGCRKDHYVSDMTRTSFYKKADDEYAKIHDIVRLANEKAELIVKPGVPLFEIDAAARNLISEAGYGQYFTHRLGHFCGQTDHEQGDVSSANHNVAKEGMVFSIEPGIYLPGKFGVRVEDLVLVTKDGCQPLNHVDKHWKVLK